MNNLLDHILETEDIFKPVSPEEIPGRRKQYLKSVFDKAEVANIIKIEKQMDKLKPKNFWGTIPNDRFDEEVVPALRNWAIDIAKTLEISFPEDDDKKEEFLDEITTYIVKVFIKYLGE